MITKKEAIARLPEKMIFGHRYIYCERYGNGCFLFWYDLYKIVLISPSGVRYFYSSDHSETPLYENTEDCITVRGKVFIREGYSDTTEHPLKWIALGSYNYWVDCWAKKTYTRTDKFENLIATLTYHKYTSD